MMFEERRIFNFYKEIEDIFFIYINGKTSAFRTFSTVYSDGSLSNN